MELHLNGHIAVVTGGASGIGRAAAEAFAAEGAEVALWDFAPNVMDVAGEIAAGGSGRVIGLTVDVSDEQSVLDALCETEQQLGPVRHLVHAAAMGSGKFGFPFLNLEPNDWRRVLDVNVMGMVHVAHAVAPGMIERKAGTMVFVASVAGQIGSPTDPPYSASKAANINFAQCMAKDLAAYGVRVNSLCPGMVKTPLNKSVWQSWHDRQPPESRQSYEEWAEEKLRSIVPLGQWQEPADIANMAVFLSSERAAQVTGQTVNVDGGYVIHW
jgi:2-hydroxycyclohexanecarboxyl-CoA dehydrogenase